MRLSSGPLRTAPWIGGLLSIALIGLGGCDTDEDGDTGDGDGTSQTVPDLGDTPDVQCDAGVLDLAGLRAAVETQDLEAARDAYLGELNPEDGSRGGSALQDFVRAANARTGRVADGVLTDDAAASTLLLDGSAPVTLETTVGAIEAAILASIRNDISAVKSAQPDPNRAPALLYARWDRAHCWYQGTFASAVVDADGLGLSSISLEGTIAEAFERGHGAVQGAEAWAPDDLVLPGAKQQMEKTLFAALHRDIVAGAAAAKDAANEGQARVVRGRFLLLEDRLQGRNTPGIATVVDMLDGAPGEIDPDAIARELDIAFAKRTRKYCDHAVTNPASGPGTASGIEGAYEGRAYVQTILPGMSASLADAGFDPGDYLTAWDDYVAAIEEEDPGATQAASDILVEWNCRYQTEILGLASCTSSEDETP